MAFLLDYNALVIAKVAIATKELGIANTDLLAVKNYFFRSILHIRKKFGEFGELIICQDADHNWRKDFYPYYKIGRKDVKAKAPFDWDLCRDAIKYIADDLGEYFPYKSIKVESAEADDVIATLTKHIRGWNAEHKVCSKSEEVIIGSRDQDFYPLQMIPGVSQYSLVERLYLRCADPADYLARKILKGDTGDSVPNVLSEDDAIAMKVRQQAITEMRIEKWETHRKQFGELHPDLDPVKYARNKTLVDLMNDVPENIAAKTIEEFTNATPASRIRTASYFIKNQMKELHQNIQHF